MFCLLLLQATVCYAQQEYFYQYSNRNGLPSNTIHAVTTDAQGNVWIPTEKGIAKFNGKSFKVFTRKDGLLNSDIFFAESLGDDKVWLYDYEFAFSYIENDTVHTLPYAKHGFSGKGLEKLPYLKVADWVIMNSMDNVVVAAYNNGRVFSMPSQKFVKELAPGLYSKLPENLRDTGRSSEDFKTKCKLTFYKKRIVIAFDSTVLLYDPISGSCDSLNAGELIYDDRIFKRDIQPRCFSHYFMYPSLTSKELCFIDINSGVKSKINLSDYDAGYERAIVNIIDGDSILNITTNNNTLVQINDQPEVTGTFHWNGTSDITNLTIDEQGNVWASTYNNGLFLLSGNFRGFSKIQLSDINTQIVSMYEHEGHYYLFDVRSHLYITDKDFRLMKKIFLPETYRSYPQISKGWFLPDGKDGYFIATAYGNYYLTKDYRLLNYDMSDVYTSFKNYYYDSAYHRVVAAHSGGLLVFGLGGDMSTRQIFANTPQRILQVNKLGNNTYYCTGDHPVIYKCDTTLYYNDSIKIHGKIAFSTVDDDRFVFAVEDYGIYCYDNPSSIGVQLVKSDDLFSFYKKGKKGIWVGNKDYLMELQYSGGCYIVNRKYLNLKGLLYNEIFDIAECDTGAILLCDNGLIRLPAEPDLYKDEHFTSSARLAAIYLQDKNEYFFNVNDSAISFSYSPASMKLKFTSNSTAFLGEVYYRYYIEGESEGWLSTDDEIVNYPSLSPGVYMLHIKAGVKHIELDTKEHVFTITVTPLWWQSLLFKGCVGLVIIGLIGYIIYIRIKVIKRRAQKESELNSRMAELELNALQSQMNPHFIFNSLTSIQSYINTNRSADADKLLRQFSLLVRLYLEFSRSKLISLDREIKALKLYTEIERTRFDERFDVKFEVENTLGIGMEDVYLPPMLIQPLVENAINHGLYHRYDDEGLLLITMKVERDKTTVVIDDNGIGRTEAKKLRDKAFPSVGNQLINERIAILNESGRAKASIEVLDKYNDDGTAAGTLVRLIIINRENDKSNNS